jgi:hypothetical protein
MAVSCPPNVEPEHTQNKAQFGRRAIAAPRDLTASGISYGETGHSMLQGITVERDKNATELLSKIGFFQEVFIW